MSNPINSARFIQIFKLKAILHLFAMYLSEIISWLTELEFSLVHLKGHGIFGEQEAAQYTSQYQRPVLSRASNE